MDIIRNGENLLNYLMNWIIPGSGKVKEMNAILTTLEEEGDMHLPEVPGRNTPVVAEQNRGPPHAHVVVEELHRSGQLPIDDENGNPQVPEDDEDSIPDLED